MTDLLHPGKGSPPPAVPLDEPLAASAAADPAAATPAPSSGPRIGLANVLNLLGYLISLATSYLGGVAGWFGGKSNLELSSQYQTLLTPAASYFGYVWAVIFLSEGFFAAAQLLPRYKRQPLVRKGIGYVYFLACLAQAAWSIFFGLEFMVTAFCAMAALLVALVVILKRQWGVVAAEEKKTNTALSLGETELEERELDTTAKCPRPGYWLLRFPFGVHAGWIAPATPLMLCVLLVAMDVDATYEMWVAVISLPLLFGGCMGLLLREDAGAPAYVFPGTVAYAFTGICWELQGPSNVVLGRHDEASVNLMKNLSGFCAACLLVVMFSRCAALFIRDQCLKRRRAKEDEEDVTMIDGVEYVQA